MRWDLHFWFSWRWTLHPPCASTLDSTCKHIQFSTSHPSKMCRKTSQCKPDSWNQVYVCTHTGAHTVTHTGTHRGAYRHAHKGTQGHLQKGTQACTEAHTKTHTDPHTGIHRCTQTHTGTQIGSYTWHEKYPGTRSLLQPQPTSLYAGPEGGTSLGLSFI